MRSGTKNILFWMILAVLVFLSASLFGQDAAEAVAENAAGNAVDTTGWGLALGALGAALATFMGGSGSAWGLGVAAHAASGALSEDPSKFGIIFPIEVLAGTQGIYGLLIGFLILTKIGVLGGNVADMTIEKGLYAVFCGLPIGVAGLVSGYWQGAASASSIQLVSRKPSEFGKAIIFPALVETYAVFGLLISFMLWLKL